jgi:RHS repeat-associated protein
MPKRTVEYLISVCRVIFLLFGLTTVCMAQDASIKRGFQPGNSFAIGDFETINTTNGNLMLRFPLGSLPGGRNGLSAGINLFYNSKLYDSETQWFVVDNQACEIVGDLAGEGIVRCPYYQKSVLKESPQGGWQFGTMYTLKLIDRRDQFLNIPPEKQPQCLNTNSYGSWSPGYYEMRYHYKLILNFPDGSSHEMRPNGWSDGNFNDPLGDWFDIRPDGYWFDCQNTQWYQNTITYYSADGSFLRLDIQHDGDSDPLNNPWTLYFPDGSKVTSNQTNNEPQRLYDRNNNYLELLGSEIRDQFNRSVGVYISWNNGDPISTVTSQGFGETLTWTIHWKFISVLKSYWPCAQSLQCPTGVQQQEPYGYPRLVIDTITMPAQAGGLTYRFHYNAPDHASGQPLSPSLGWGEISGITLPSGAEVSYTWAQDGTPVTNFTPDILQNAPTGKVLHYDQEYDGAVTPVPDENWTFDISASGTSIVTAPDGGVTMTGFTDPSAPFWNAGLTFSTTGPDGTKTETIWERNNLANSSITNPYPKTVFTSIKNAAGAYVKTSIKDYKYDKNGNVTRVAEYDWINYDDVPRSFGMATSLPAGVSPTRVTVNTYFNSTPDATQLAGSNTSVYWSSGSPRVKNAIASSEIRKIVAGSEVAVSRTEYTYDNPSVPANVTQVRSWDSTKGAYSNPLTSANSLIGTMQYNQYGMPTLISDPRGVQTLMTYGAIGTATDLYPTQIKTAYQTAQERTESREYNLATGLVTRVTDVDNNVSTATTYDPFSRLTLVTAAEGKPEETRTTYQYSDLLRRVITRTDLTTVNDGKLVSIQHYDQLGRVRLSRRLEDSSSQSATDENAGIKVQTRYRYSGANSYVLVSNAYRAATSGAASAEQTMGWTRTKSDDAGRVMEVQTFSGAALPAPWGSNSTSTGTVNTAYDANFTNVSDQTQKQRRSMFDGLGRLLRVDEPNASGNLGDAVSPNQPTHYSYDVVGNLILVTQSDGTTTQQRTFTYSSLSRLTQATTPESGTTNYKFDDAGNLVVRTDGRGISTHYSYDALNRITRRWYNSSNSVSATTHEQALPGGTAPTDEARFYYDLQSLPPGAPAYSRGAARGRLVAQLYGTGTNGDYLGYDGIGRSILKVQQTGQVNYRFAATYNLAGGMTSLTYPSDHSITNTFDQAGRLTVFNGNIGDGTSRTYSAGILYSPAGAMVKEQFGTNTAIYNKLFYNSRGQLAEMRASTSYTGPTDMDANRGAIINSYSDQCSGVCSGSSMTDNNGNLKKQDVLIPNQPARWQQYEYDSLNRLKWAREVLSGVEQWKQQFTYDRWGNRRIDTAVTYGIGINKKAVDVNPNTNQLLVPSGQSGLIEYDAAGNLKNDTYTGAGARAYDAENKITSAGGWDNQSQLYSYDGSGQRIKRTAYGVQTWHVYGFGGELLAEYPANGAANLPQKEYGYRNGQLLVTAEPTTAAPVNVASAANGATATASSFFSGFGASGAINGDRKGLYVVQNGYWSTAGPGFSAWLEVQFNGSKTITEVDVVTTQDNYNAPVEPTESATFSLYGLTAYQVEYWNGSAWALIPGSTVSSNNKVWKKFSFAAITTTKIRVVTSASVDNYSRITEVEAWTGPSPAPRYNLALSSMGAVATASNSYNSGYGPAGANNGDRKSTNWTNGGGWNDSGPPFPDWLQIDFGSVKTINEVNVFTLQDNYANSAEPTESMTFSLWGLTGYQLEYWDGSNWVSPANCSVTGNNKIWRKFNFSSISTSKIRILTNASIDGYSRITEVEAYAPADTGASGNGVHWLVADHLGTPRMIFDQTGDLANMKRHDYLPFGEELFAPAGGRTAAQGYATGDGVRQQFTSKERDVETSLDYFGARFYAPTLGRFASCDPNASSSRHVVNPQRWNLYSHVLNNPLVLYDPDGQSDQTKDKTKIIIDIFLFADPGLKGGDTMTTSQRQKLDKIVSQGKKVGVQINVFEGPADATGIAAADSLKNSDVVIFGPHSGLMTNGVTFVPTEDGNFMREGLQLAFEEEPRSIEINASVVGVMGCDSALVRHAFYGADTFIGVNGGANHVSTTYGLNDAIIAMAGVIVKANGELGPKTINAVKTKAQTAIRTPYSREKRDQDDTVVVNPAVVPPPSKKTPY